MTDFSKNLPSNSKSVPEDTTDARTNFVALEERLEVEHRFPANAEPVSQQGRHKFGVGTTAARDAAIPTPQSGNVWGNLDLAAWEFHDGTDWRNSGAIIGEVKWLAYKPTTLPYGWLACEGQEVSETTYSKLFAVLGSQYGAAGPGQFRLPDHRKNVIVGLDDGGSDWATAIGETGGAKEVTLQPTEVPPNESQTPGTDAGDDSTRSVALVGALVSDDSHTHTVDAHDHAPTAPAPQAHQNRQPYVVHYGIIFAGQ